MHNDDNHNDWESNFLTPAQEQRREEIRNEVLARFKPADWTDVIDHAKELELSDLTKAVIKEHHLDTLLNLRLAFNNYIDYLTDEEFRKELDDE